ncbi:MAG: InlB B-repeat-containing protein, partial [Treponema sp.]
MLKKILLAVFTVVSIFLYTTCKNQLDVKDFIEKGFSTALFRQAPTFTDAVLHNSINYIPSGKRITVTVPIGNRMNQELEGTAAVPADKEHLFHEKPTIKKLTPDKAIIEFKLKDDAEPNLASQFLTQPIPMTLTLTVKNQGRAFGSLTIPLYCNTQPVKPSPYTIDYDADTDMFTFNLPAKSGIHQDLDKIEATVEAPVTNTASGGSIEMRKKTISIPLSGTLPPSLSLLPSGACKLNLAHADVFGTAIASGTRSCSLRLYDKTGLSVDLGKKEDGKYTVSFTVVNGQGGSLTGQRGSDAAAAQTASGTTEKRLIVKHGGTVSFTAAPETGWQIAGWSSSVTVDISDNKKATLANITADTTVTVQFKKNQYSVTFDAQGGTPVPQDQTIDHGDMITVPSPMSKAGYTFGGWYKEAACTTQWNFATDTVTGNTTLYAKWTGNPYTVQFNGGTGSSGSMSAQPFVYGTAQNLTANTFTKTGYTFAGWATSAGGSKEYTDGQSVNNLTTVQGGTVSLYAKWTANTYTVHFDGNGHTGGSMSDQTFTYDEALKPLRQNTFTKTGYTFGGWATSSSATTATYTNQASVNNLTAAPNGTFTLYAKWNPRNDTRYIVKHLKQNVTGSGYTEVDTETLQGTTDGTPTVTPKTYTGFEAGSYTPTTIAADGSTVVEVKYNRKVYTVTFNANGGSPAPSNQPVRYEGTASTPSISKTGYTFGGWYKEAAFTTQWNFTTDTVTGNTNLHAKWNPRNDTQYIVKHLKQNVTGSGYTEVTGDRQTLQGTTDAAPTVPLKTYTGFQAGTYTPTTIAADGSTVVEVKYDRVRYTVSFNANGGTPAFSTQSVRYEGTASTPSISKTGYVGGWYKSSTYTGAAWNFASNTITADITLYAKWTANTYKVRFNSNGGSGSMNDQPFTYDEAPKQLSQNTFTKTNYWFTGWATSPGSSTVVHIDKKSVNNLTPTNGDVVNLYAVWVPLPKVTFKVEGGIGGKLKCMYDGTTQEASGNTEKYFIVEYSTAKSATFTAVPDSGWAL